jgi:hypothetical protein
MGGFVLRAVGGYHPRNAPVVGNKNIRRFGGEFHFYFILQFLV